MSADGYGLDKQARNEEARRQEAKEAELARRGRRLNPDPPYRVVAFDPDYFGVLRAEWGEGE